LAQRDEVIERAVAADNRPPSRLAYSVAKVRLNVTKLTMAKVSSDGLRGYKNRTV
jgi:hypothetical protein